MILLKKADELIKQKKYRIVNIDSIVIMQKPKIASYIDKMRERISEVLEIPFENVGVKATTEEYLGFTGSGEGVKALSNCLLVGSDPYN
jgi:2-C-methyl-D-erythritol 2,4-cyclodiphosphate synthase